MPQRSQAPRVPPQQYQFSDEDREQYSERFWKMPRRLVTSELWAKLWRGQGTKRGGGTVTSILPVLALHTWPGKKNMDGANAGADPEPGWTGWTYLSRRRIARLAGIDKDAATTAIARLTAEGLMETRRVAREKYEGGYRTYYRLSAELYPRDESDPYAQISGNLFYGGSWFMLPTAAARHMYAVLACLDPIGNETAYLAKIAEDRHLEGGAWSEIEGSEDVWRALSPSLPRDLAENHRHKAWMAAIRADLLARQRKQHPVSLTELEKATAMNRGTVTEALHVLTTPVFGDRRDDRSGDWTPPIPLVAKGVAEPRRPTWYAPDRRAWGWFWYPALLNDRVRVEAERRRLWPDILNRRARMGTLVKRLSTTHGVSAWTEARDIRELRDRRLKVRLPATPADLAKAIGRPSSSVEQALRIATDLTGPVLRHAGADDTRINSLPRAALLRAARAGTPEERARQLAQELAKAGLSPE